MARKKIYAWFDIKDMKVDYWYTLTADPRTGHCQPRLGGSDHLKRLLIRCDGETSRVWIDPEILKLPSIRKILAMSAMGVLQ